MNLLHSRKRRDVAHVFPTALPAVSDWRVMRMPNAISLAIENSEFVCLIGHSGCGKSTLLNIVAGLLAPTKGAIRCAGKSISGPGPERAMVFKDVVGWLDERRASAAPGAAAGARA